jgi:hypothetical protein
MRPSMKLTNKQRAFLRRRLDEMAKSQPEIWKLRELLLSIGGEELCTPPGGIDNAVTCLLVEGTAMQMPVLTRPMEVSHCHANVATLWKNRELKLIAICGGYALSGDGIWRQHWWGLTSANIVETTESRTAYFGIHWTGKEAHGLAAEILRTLKRAKT